MGGCSQECFSFTICASVRVKVFVQAWCPQKEERDREQKREREEKAMATVTEHQAPLFSALGYVNSSGVCQRSEGSDATPGSAAEV